ncbi:MAG: hypothetical protein ABEJ88_00730 [Halobacterium sp.]
MPSLLSRASRVAGRAKEYALVPVALTLLAFRNVLEAASASGVSLNVKFALPADVATLWTVVDPPTRGVAFQSPVPLLFVPVFLVVEAAVVAGYLGGVRDAYRGRRPDFAAAASDHWLSILGVRVVQFLLFFALVAVLSAGGFGVLLLVGFPLVFVLGYLLWGAPYLVVRRDSDAVTALAESATVALNDSRYFGFTVAYVVVAAACSLLLSPVVTGMGLFGVLAGTVVVAYPSLVATAAATIVVDEAASSVASRGP